MKKIKLEVSVDDKVAVETLAFLQNLMIKNVHEYYLSMEDYGLLQYGPDLGEIENA